MKPDDRQGQEPAAGEAEAMEDPPPPESELVGSLKRLGDELVDLFRAGADLVTAESRLFASSLLLIVVLAVVAGFLVAGAVIFIGATVALLLMQYGGLDAVIAVLLVTVTMLVAIVGIVLWMRGLSRHLRFEHSRQMLAELAARKPKEDRQ